MIRGYKVHQMWTDLEPSPWASRQAGARLSLHNPPGGQQVRQSMGHWAWAGNMDMGSGRGLTGCTGHSEAPSFPSFPRPTALQMEPGRERRGLPHRSGRAAASSATGTSHSLSLDKTPGVAFPACQATRPGDQTTDDAQRRTGEMLRRRLAVCGPRALPLVRESERERMRAWSIHLEPQTECTGTSTGTNQQTKHKGQPSLIGRKPPHARLPVSEGSCQSPDTRDDDSLAQLHSQSYSTSPKASAAAAAAAAPTAVEPR